MSTITHPATGFTIGDPDSPILQRDSLPSPGQLAEAARPLILSASGWRKVFASDGNEESPSPALSAADRVLAGAAALAFGRFIIEKVGYEKPSPKANREPDGRAPAILVGMDSRPTGPALAEVMIRVFLGMGLRVRYLFIVAAPEIMAYANSEAQARLRFLREGDPAEAAGRAAGFCYISASHNPRGHNGLKFGVLSGGVLGGEDSARLIQDYKELLGKPSLSQDIAELVEAAPRRETARAFTECSAWKRHSISAYTLLAREIVSGSEDAEVQDLVFDAMEAGAAKRPLGIIAELNGSARCLSIDRDFLEGLGLRCTFINDHPRDFAHRIVPEGESLDQARAELEKALVRDPAYCLGYVPDCDGDRGNLVVAVQGKARALEAQETFALACISELASLVRAGILKANRDAKQTAKVAIVVNDATSMRIEAIAAAFGAETFRAETGEANVVGLAEALREKGYVVRILGEGSNGGNITQPSKVRDPLATVCAALKLLLVRGEGTAQGGGLYAIWLERARTAGIIEAVQAEKLWAQGDYSLGDILSSLPSYVTTSVFEARAALRLAGNDKLALKKRYTKIFLSQWEKQKPELERRFGILSWKALASQGQVESSLDSDFSASGSGGLRIVFYGNSGQAKAFLWLRGSGTEAVLRIMADIAGGSAEDEEYLLAWQTAMVREADLA